MLLRLCCLLLHPNDRQSAPRTPEPAADPDSAGKALADCGRAHSQPPAVRSTECAGRDVGHRRDRGPGGHRICSPVPDRGHTRGGDGGAPVRNACAHRMPRASAPRAAARECVPPRQRRHAICLGPHEARPQGRVLGVPECVRDSQGRPCPVGSRDPPRGDDAVRRVQERRSYHVVSVELVDVISGLLTYSICP
jgi:hypothetical protein